MHYFGIMLYDRMTVDDAALSDACSAADNGPSRDRRAWSNLGAGRNPRGTV